jgi:hypothetical protein
MSSSGGGSSGGGSSGSGASGSNTSGQITATQLAGSIGTTSSILNSFNQVGTGSGSSAVSPTNPLAAYYYNPMAQGYITVNSSGSATASNTPFGQALYGNVSSGGSSTSGRSSSSAFGGTSNSGSLGSFGGSSASRSTTTGSASVRSGTTGTATLFTGGGSYGPAIGRKNAVIAAALKNPPRVITAAARRPDLQAIIARSSSLSNPNGIVVLADGGQIVLSGTVASEDERILAANLLRLSTGGSNLRNELTVGPGGGNIPGPGPMAAPIGGTPGPAPSAPPIGGIR